MSTQPQKRSKTLYIFLAVILGLALIAGVAVAFMLNYNTYAPSAPVVLDDGQNIYISTTLNDNYKGYRFKFVDQSEKQIVIDSENNELSVQEMLENKITLGETYKISVCYLAENVGNNSEYSDSISWKCQKYLEMPLVSYDEVLKKISWPAVTGADYYKIYINGNHAFYETTGTSYDLSDLEGGDKTINVVGYSNDSNLLTSNKSNSLQVKLIIELDPFKSIDFDRNTNIITAVAPTQYQKIKIYLGDTDYQSILFDVTRSGNDYIYKIDITTIYQGENLIGICPCTIDQYNVYNGGVVYYNFPII